MFGATAESSPGVVDGERATFVWLLHLVMIHTRNRVLVESTSGSGTSQIGLWLTLESQSITQFWSDPSTTVTDAHQGRAEDLCAPTHVK